MRVDYPVAAGLTPASSAGAPTPPCPPTHLAARRIAPSDASTLAASGQWLGSIAYQATTSDVPALQAGVALRALSANASEMDAWLAGPGIQAGRSADVAFHTDGHWLFGSFDSTEDAAAEGLESLAYRAYSGIFQTLAAAGVPHLVRLWNYLPHINREQLGLERYRQFNLGRQQAFLDAERDAFAGAPAACALGTTEDGRFRVRFLASRQAPVPLENPRQVPAWRYPSEFGPRSPTFSRAVLVPTAPGQLTLLISGTASILGSATVHLGDVHAQADETLRNLQAVIDAAHQRGSARFTLDALRCTAYVRHAADVDRVRARVAAAVGEDSITARHMIYVQADICRGDLLVEIEAHATAAGVLT